MYSFKGAINQLELACCNGRYIQSYLCFQGMYIKINLRDKNANATELNVLERKIGISIQLSKTNSVREPNNTLWKLRGENF